VGACGPCGDVGLRERIGRGAVSPLCGGGTHRASAESRAQGGGPLRRL
jgi:hypothetical protein